MKIKYRLNIFASIVVIYLLLALVWWAILLGKKNHEVYVTKVENIKLYKEKSLGISQYDTSNDPEVKELTATYNKQHWMIFGEGLFFGLSLILGIGFIMKSSQQIIAVNKQQNNFLLAITHELKTPVSSVKLILQTIQKRVLSKEQLEHLSTSGLEENHRLENLIDNILFSTKILDGYLFHFDTIEIDQLVQQSIKPFSKRFKDRNIHFHFDTNASHTIRGDFNALMIVMNNLLDNAIKYSMDDIDISLSTKNKYVQLKMEDHGKGIPESEKDNIFKKFYRPGNEDTRESKGTGLGLYLVKEIVTSHQGTVSYQKRLPEGSTFVVKIPHVS